MVGSWESTKQLMAPVKKGKEKEHTMAMDINMALLSN